MLTDNSSAEGVRASLEVPESSAAAACSAMPAGGSSRVCMPAGGSSKVWKPVLVWAVGSQNAMLLVTTVTK
jgi:hypothetical protein